MALHRLPLAAMREIEPKIGEDVFSVLSVDRSVKSRVSYGGTAPKNVRAQAKKWLRKLEKEKSVKWPEPKMGRLKGGANTDAEAEKLSLSQLEQLISGALVAI